MAMQSYTVSWTDPTVGVSFKVYDVAPTPGVLLATVPAGTYSGTISLDDVQPHTICVTAVNAGVESFNSQPVSVPPARPPAPTNVTVTKI